MSEITSLLCNVVFCFVMLCNTPPFCVCSCSFIVVPRASNILRELIWVPPTIQLEHNNTINRCRYLSLLDCSLLATDSLTATPTLTRPDRQHTTWRKNRNMKQIQYILHLVFVLLLLLLLLVLLRLLIGSYLFGAVATPPSAALNPQRV